MKNEEFSISFGYYGKHHKQIGETKRKSSLLRLLLLGRNWKSHTWFCHLLEFNSNWWATSTSRPKLSNCVSLLVISLQFNGVSVGRSLTSQPSSGTFDAISLTTSFHMNANDRVNLYNDVGVLADDILHFTSFSGWRVEEDLIKIIISRLIQFFRMLFWFY